MVDIRLANHGACPLRVAMMIGSTGCLQVEARISPSSALFRYFTLNNLLMKLQVCLLVFSEGIDGFGKRKEMRFT